MTNAKILMVENEGAMVVHLRRLLRGWGYVPIAASSGEAVLQLAAEEYPDLALMDIQLPGGMDGWHPDSQRATCLLPASYSLPNGLHRRGAAGAAVAK